MGCYNSIHISKPAEEVWKCFTDFHDLSWSKNVVTEVTKIGDIAGTKVGSKRIINNAFHETLLSLDHDSMKLTYSIDDGPAAVAKDSVTNYVGEVQVFRVSADDTSFVLWTSHWEDAKEDVAAFCNPIYHAILNDLNFHFS